MLFFTKRDKTKFLSPDNQLRKKTFGKKRVVISLLLFDFLAVCDFQSSCHAGDNPQNPPIVFPSGVYPTIRDAQC